MDTAGRLRVLSWKSSCGGVSGALCLVIFLGASQSALGSVVPAGRVSRLRFTTLTSSGSPAGRPPFHLACPTASLCVVADSTGHIFTSTSPSAGAVWNSSPITSGASFSAISCPSASLCVALDSGGDVLTSTNPRGGANAWTAGHVGAFTDLTCPSVHLCVAVGGRSVAVSTTPEVGAASWRVYGNVDQTEGPECGKYGPTDGCAAWLTHVSCPSDSFCAAVDNWGEVVQSNDPAGGTGAWSTGGAASGPAMLSLSCTSGSTCTGVCATGAGLLGISCPGTPYDAGDVVSLTAGKAPVTATISAKHLTDIWCQSDGACLTATDDGDIFATPTPDKIKATWDLVAEDNLANDSYNAIQAISCPSSAQCYAIDAAGNVLVENALAGAARLRVGRKPQSSVTRFRRVGRLPVDWNLARDSARLPRPVPLTSSQIRLPDSRVPRGLRWIKDPTRASLPRAILRAVAAGATAATPAASGSVGYGFATASGYPANAEFAYCTLSEVPCPSGDLLGYYQYGFNLFTGLRQNLPLSYARFFISYDALAYWNGSACTWSPAATNGVGVADFDTLAWEVQAAQADGLTPVVAFTNGTGTQVPNNPVPSVPDPSYGGPSGPYVAWTNAGLDYACGVQAIMRGIGAQGLGTNPVTDWEAWNEPNGATVFNGSLDNECNTNPDPCGGLYEPAGGFLCGSDYANCGPLEAAELWELAEYEYEATLPNNGFEIAALTLSDAGNSVYEDAYISQVGDMNACSSGYYCAAYFPTVFSAHDYGDPSSAVASAHSEISSFTSNLYSHYSQLYLTVWITEAGTDLNYSATSDGNRSSGCDDGEADHLNGAGLWTFGGCVDHNPSAQATGAQSFLNLGNYGNGWDITQVDWYEFQPANPSPGFDSGVVSANTGSYTSPSGLYSQPRQSFCVLEHVAGSNCSSSTLDAGDWSTNPGGPGA